MNRFIEHSRVNRCQAWHLIDRFDTCTIALKSYNTIVVSYNFKTGKFQRHWNSSSVTTLQHIRKWCDAMHIKTLDAVHYHRLPVTELD